MPVLLNPHTAETTTHTLGDGVSITMQPIRYPDYAAAYQTAVRRLAAEALAEPVPEDEAVEDPAAADRSLRRASMLELHLLDALVERHAVGWENVFDAAGDPAPLTVANWRLFRDLRPVLAHSLKVELTYPAESFIAEGNA